MQPVIKHPFPAHLHTLTFRSEMLHPVRGGQLSFLQHRLRAAARGARPSPSGSSPTSPGSSQALTTLSAVPRILAIV